MNKMTVIGLDLAKLVFQIHGVDAEGNTVLKKRLARTQMAEFFVHLEPCLVAMEACSSAHHWARQLMRWGHTPRLIPPQYVKPFVKTNKHDAADAAAIATAARQPDMPTVVVKAPEQQAILSVHRAREGLVKSRTALCNQIRGLLTEFGVVLPVGAHQIQSRVPALVEAGENDLPDLLRQLIQRLYEHLKHLAHEIEQCEAMIASWHRQNEASQRLAAIPGVGLLTATAIVATVGDARHYCHGRQLAAALGLVPKQCSSGGRERLLGISKRGDSYLRRLLIHGARTVWRARQKHPDFEQTWLGRLAKRRPTNVALVALANQRARTIWAMLYHGRCYDPNFKPALASAHVG
ncbi:MAG: IS110 family transposase [Candidatus Competibacteraceae bacterium]|nr:IS110 family transposase [Candidatus Competibacteraceae bacterium]